MSEKKTTVIEEFEKKMSDIAYNFCTNCCKYHDQMDEWSNCEYEDDCPLIQMVTFKERQQAWKDK